MLLSLVLCLSGFGNWCIFSPDCFLYLEVARTLADTGGFPACQFQQPPGFALVIAPLLCSADLPFLALRGLLAACWAMTAAMTYALYRKELGGRLAWLAGLFVASSPVLFYSTLTPLSEPVFTVLSLITLIVMTEWWRRPVRSGWFVALGGLLTAAAFMVRSMGLVLLPVMAFALLHHRNEPVARRAIWAGVFAFCTLGPLAAWHAHQSQYSVGYGYGQVWTNAREAEATSATGLSLQVERLRKFAPSRLEAIKEAVLPKDLAWRAFNPPLDTPTTWLIGGFFVVVATGRFLWLRSPVDLYALLTLFMLSLWPWNEGVRLVAPLIPIFIGYPLWVGLAIWRRARGRRWVPPVLISVILLWLVLQAAGMVVAQSRLPALKAKAQHRMAMTASIAAWLDAHMPKGATWIGVTPDADESKIMLLGAAYLARRPVTTIDVRDKSRFDLDLTEGTRAFVHDTLAGFTQEKWGYVPIAREFGFVVFERARPN
jgi:4-amino-4-deoxy-L-arabinose transferase-like glycosyltransferase